MSKKVGGTQHSLIDFAYSKEVVRDMPKLLSIYDKLIPVLEQYQQYTGAWSVLQSVYDAKMLLEIQYEYYKSVHDAKGLVHDGE